jgi:hypothetical protein
VLRELAAVAETGTAFCAIRSYLATAAKHGVHFFDALTMLAEHRPWLPDAA